MAKQKMKALGVNFSKPGIFCFANVCREEKERIMGKQQKEGSSLVNFGKAGWGTIIFCMAMFWFFVGFCTDGNNLTAPAVAKHLGIQSGTVLQMNSYGGILGVIFILDFHN